MSFELTKEYYQSISVAIENNDSDWISSQLDELYPADIAEILDSLDLGEGQYILKLLDEEKAADVLVELEEDVREKLLSAFTTLELAGQFKNMESDDAADVFAELSVDRQEEVLQKIDDAEHASDIVDLLNYNEDSAGGLMAKELVSVSMGWNVKTCIDEIRKQAEEIDEFYTVYVTDFENHLIGILPLKELITSTEESKVSDIMSDDVISVKAHETSEEVALIMKKYDMVVLPVVDQLDRLIGRITIDDVVDVIQEEAEKDYQMASGIAEKVESGDKIWLLSRARLPWLIIGLIGGVLGAKVIQIFDVETQNIHLVFFIPLITAMAGNVGVQSSAIIVQGLANKSIGFDSLTSKLLKELGVALINGSICSALLMGYTLLFIDSFALCLTVSVALLSVIIFASIFGTFIPLLLNRFKVDPALATGPFITTANDILGLFLYFIIGQFIFSMA